MPLAERSAGIWTLTPNLKFFCTLAPSFDTLSNNHMFSNKAVSSSAACSSWVSHATFVGTMNGPSITGSVHTCSMVHADRAQWPRTDGSSGCSQSVSVTLWEGCLIIINFFAFGPHLPDQHGTKKVKGTFWEVSSNASADWLTAAECVRKLIRCSDIGV